MKTVLKTATLSVVLAMSLYAAPAKDTKGSILSTYAAIAQANYADALSDAKGLEKAIKAFSAAPSEATMAEAKAAWLKSRESYGMSEAFRLQNGPIDAEEGWVADAYGAPEGQLNAWPLDENMIDYTIDADGKKTSGNIIDTRGKFNPGGEDAKEVDVTSITVEAISALNENGGEANVASGYHAIEFLLWGQDQDYGNFMSDTVTNGATTAGQRPLSDYTSDANADRRKAYLNAAAQKIVADLESISGAWSSAISADCSKDATGCYRGAILGELKGKDAAKNIDPKEALKQIMAGLGVFIKSELANERIAVAVLTPSEEDEHSCFSDNTHRDIAQNYQGFKNILLGQYGAIKGVSLMDKVDPKTKKVIENLMGSIEAKIAKVDQTAKTTAHFDYQIRPENPMAEEIKKLKNEMRKLGDMMVLVAKANGIRLSSDEVTDAEETKI
jgi:putative iron-regulated protein